MYLCVIKLIVCDGKNMAIPNTRFPNKSGIRVFDTVLSIIILWILTYIILQNTVNTKTSAIGRVGMSLVISLVLLFPLAIATHSIFRVNTRLQCMLGISSPNGCDNLYKERLPHLTKHKERVTERCL
jgi:hypothetical protein